MLKGTASKNSSKNDNILKRHRASEHSNKDSSSKITIEKSTIQSQHELKELKTKLAESNNENASLKRKLAEFEQRFDDYKVKLASEQQRNDQALEIIEKFKSTDKDNFKGIK